MISIRFSASRVFPQAPKVNQLLDSARGYVARLLQDNAVDMALERPLDMPEWVSTELFFRSPFVVIASNRNRLLANLEEGDTIPLELFSKLPHALRSIDGALSGMVDTALAALGLSRNVTLAPPHFQGVALAVATSMHIAAVPVQFADAVKEGLGLRTYCLPIDVPAPDVNLYWHTRYDNNLAHEWMRARILASVRALGFVLD